MSELPLPLTLNRVWIFSIFIANVGRAVHKKAQTHNH